MSGRGSPSRKLSCSVIERELASTRSARPRAPARWGTGRRPGGPPPRKEGFGRAEPWWSDRPFVRLSGLGEALRKGDQRPNSRALRAFWSMRSVAFEPEGAGDIHVRPLGAVLHSGFEEGGGGDGTSGPSTGAVSDVGHLTLDLVAVLVREGHRPHPIAGRRGGHADDIDERVRLTEVPAEVLAQADRDRPGQGP